MEQLKQLSIGTFGIASLQITPELIPASTSDVSGIIQVAVQILIGIATLFGLLRKKK